MRLARLLLISGLAARAVADGRPAADEDPYRWSLRALTGGRYDATARPADAASPTRNVTNVHEPHARKGDDGAKRDKHPPERACDAGAEAQLFDDEAVDEGYRVRHAVF